MQLHLDSPLGFLVVPALLLIAAAWPWSGFGRPLRTALLSIRHSPRRAALLVLVAFALARPILVTPWGKGHLWLLIDRSESAAKEIGPQIEEWETLIERNKPPLGELHKLEFAEEVVLHDNSPGESRTLKGSESRLGQAMSTVLVNADPKEQHRMLLLSDGYATDQLSGFATTLTQRGIPLDIRLLAQVSGDDVRVGRLSIPQQVLPGEPLLIEGEILGSVQDPVPFKVSRDGETIFEDVALLKNGRAVVRLVDTLLATTATPAVGSHRYDLTITPSHDRYLANNHTATFVTVMGESTVLLLSGLNNDPLVEVLRNAGHAVRTPDAPRDLDQRSLVGVKSVIINNLHASRLAPEFLRALADFVTIKGGGLLMVGGEQAFDAGGYFGTPLAAVLPVSLEQREQHHKTKAAVVFVLDRSGSMGIGVPGSIGNLTKMDLANEGTARSIMELSPRDSVGIVAVDSHPFTVVQLQEVGSQKNSLVSAARSVSSGGGGIFVYTGLEAGFTALEQASAATRHLVLFADAADAEEPGKYQDLVARMHAAGMTISVIGLGTPHDSDAALLEDIAMIGGGHSFFVDNAMDLPVVFVQDTVAMVRSQFIKEPLDIALSSQWHGLSAKQLPWPPQVNAYNLTYQRPGAAVAAIGATADTPPILAFWRHGAGKAAAIATPLVGPHAGAFANWQHLGSLLDTLVRWLEPAPLPHGVRFRQERVGTAAVITILLGDEWQTTTGFAPPVLHLRSSRNDSLEEPNLTKLSPGSYQFTRELKPDEVIDGAISFGNTTIPLSPVTLAESAELEFNPESYRTVRHLSHLSGGQDRVNLADAWQALAGDRHLPLQNILVIVILLLTLSDALLTRLQGTPIGKALATRGQYSSPKPLIGRVRETLFSSKGFATAAQQTARHATPESEVAADDTSAQPPHEEPRDDEDLFAKAKRRGL